MEKEILKTREVISSETFDKMENEVTDGFFRKRTYGVKLFSSYFNVYVKELQEKKITSTIKVIENDKELLSIDLNSFDFNNKEYVLAVGMATLFANKKVKLLEEKMNEVVNGPEVISRHYEVIIYCY